MSKHLDHQEERAPGLFEPDTLLASQYFDRIRRRSEHNGERMLMIAVLEDAVNTYLKYGASPEPRHRELFVEAEEWVESRDASWLYSFQNICDVLGLDAEYVRRGLRASRGRTAPRRDEPVIRVRTEDERLRGASNG